MSDIQEQISNNEKLINDMNQNIIRLRNEIKSLISNSRLSESERVKQKYIRQNAIKNYRTNITALTKTNKALLRQIPQQTDEELERELEQLMRQEEENRISNEQKIPIEIPNDQDVPIANTKSSVSNLIPIGEEKRINLSNIGNIGFTETLKKEKPKEPQKISKNKCPNIFKVGSEVNTTYFFPSQFPKLTRIKSITVSNKKGGKRKTRKYSKRKFT